MRILIAFAGISLAAFGARLATPQLKVADGCDFKVSESETKAALSGPESVIAIAHVIDQPDSPVEILSADFKDSFITISDETITDQLRCSIKVRNRSNHAVGSFSLITEIRPANLRIGAGSGFAFVPETQNGRSLAPGQELDIEGCGGSGHASAPNNRAVLLLAVETVTLKACTYLPSRRLPDFFVN